MRSRHWAIAAAALLAACQGEEGPPGTPGNDGAGYIPLEKNGVVGLVTDPGGAAVAGGTVYFVPATDVRDLGVTTTAVNSETDEPLEDAIRRFGAGYARADVGTQGADKGVYRLATLPAGSYFVTYVPAGADHLPGGSLCRVARASSALVDTRLDIEVSAAIPAGAEYVGSSRCVGCHGRTHISGTMHRLGIWSPYAAGPLQDIEARRADLYKALARFDAGTTIYFFGYDGTRGFDKYHTWETDPALAAWATSTTYRKGAVVANVAGTLYEATTAGTSGSTEPTGTGTGITDGTVVWKSIPGVSFTVRVYKSGNEYRMLFTDVAGTSGTLDRKLDAVYGGGVNKQRYLTKVGSASDFFYVTLPLQFNQEGSDSRTDRTSKVWRDYNSAYWYSEATKTLGVPSDRNKSFEKNCMSCHALGVKIDPTTFKAQTVADPYFGDFDYDGDGVAEELNIGCETCHGPGSAHWDEGGRGKHIVSPRLLTPEREAMVCGQCHSRPLGKLKTDSPVDANGRMFVAGGSRDFFLENHAGGLDKSGNPKLDATAADLWGDGATETSQGNHSKAHHQQYTDFIRSKLYKNATELMTCSSCHDPHRRTVTAEGAPIARQLRKDPNDNAQLCGQCHEAGQAALEAHVKAVGIYYPASGTHSHSTSARCVDCHMPKTAQTGASQPSGIVGDDTLHEYAWSDVTSHVFDVPLKAASIAKKMPTAYTNPCGGCHTGNGM